MTTPASAASRQDQEWTLPGVPPEHALSARLKIEMLASGLRLDRTAEELLHPQGKRPRVKVPVRTRSGVSGGLDLVLPGNVFVNAPVLEPFTTESELGLGAVEGRLWVDRDGRPLCEVEAISAPRFYSRSTSDGSRPLRSIGQMCSPDRFCYGMTGPGCSFWRADQRCRYCSIGSAVNTDGLRKRESHLLEALEAACEEPEWPARHVLLGGGTPAGDDMGAELAARLCRRIKADFDLPVYVMIVAPLRDEHIDRLHDAGVDEVGFNLEFWGDSSWRSYIPGKHARVGKHRYLKALEYAVGLFGPVRTRSILIAGLESAEETLAGATALAQMGVMPILSPFRPLEGADLVSHRGFAPREYAALYAGCEEIAESAGLPLGPTCVCCQNNTLAFPFGPQYRRY